ncbi:GAF domain-containing protein [Uniformispora flossi]|uniref:GAF domain-containing protein n=1 Tax=Uniformispora flossi TaxID=3390723 RepID=UPI003C2CEC01
MSDRQRAGARDRASRGGTSSDVRTPIRASWARARRSGLAPDAYLPPVPLVDDDLEHRRQASPLAHVWPLLRRSLANATSGPSQLLFLSDAEGHLLWVEGEHATLRVAERAHLLPGALWSEDAAGTSGVGTTLATGRPFQVFGSEHFLSAATAFTCTGTPIHDPGDGRLLGVLDFTCAARDWQPLAVALLDTARRLAVSELGASRLREEARVRTRYVDRLAKRLGTRSAIVAPDGRVVHADPPGWLPSRLPGKPAEGPVLLPGGQAILVERLSAGGLFLVTAGSDLDGFAVDPVLRFRGLGRARAIVEVAGATHELGRRHSEIVALLLADRGGMNAKALAAEVYGPQGRPITVRAELARLRAVLGHRLASEPYRLTEDCEADFLDLDRDLSTCPADVLLDRYPGPLLPGSTAPGVVALRARLAERLRRRVEGSGDADTVIRWEGSPHGRGRSGE